MDCVTEDTQKSSLISEMCVVVWMEEEVLWYFGFVCKDIGDDKYLVEHLERHPSQNDFWRHPKVKDVQTIIKGQILPCRVDGIREILAPTVTRIDSKYHLNNSRQIKNQFTKITTRT